jgi:hypothetical protein
VPLDEDDFMVLPGHLADTAGSGAPPAARAAVERLPVVVVGGEAHGGGCRVGTSTVLYTPGGGSPSATPVRWKTGSQSPFNYAFLGGVTY